MRPAPLIAALALATAAFGAQAFPGNAGPGPGPGLQGLKSADANGDGMISRAEAAALPRLAERFDALDTNKDGLLTFEEIRAQHQGRHGDPMKRFDANGDGVISRAEAAAFPRLAERFDELDANKDGNLAADELRAHRGAGRGGDRLARVDTNGDGLIDRAEAQANAPRLAEHFDEIDTNKDGVISRDEMRAAHHARRW